MNAVDFYKLERPIQDRFVGSVMSGFPPAPLLVRRGGRSAKRQWIGLSAASVVALVVLAKVGYGTLGSALGVHAIWILPVYGALVFGAVFGVVQAWAIVVRERALPYSPGVYLFPACLIDARTESFAIHATADLASVVPAADGRSLVLSFRGGTRFEFGLVDPAATAAIVREVEEARDRAMHARADGDPKELVAVDPLHNPRFSSPVGPRVPYELQRPAWGRLGWGVALGVAVLLGPLLWALRNVGSDRTMFARAIQENDSAAYRAYLSVGKRYRDDVRGTLLPRAELRDAEAVGTVDALLAYRDAHPDSKIEGEVTVAVRAAMLRALEGAKKNGDLASLSEFARRYPEHGIGPELEQARHVVYARELAKVEERAGRDKAATAFVERLFAWVEKHGPKVEVRFRRKRSENLGQADQHVGKDSSFMGEASYPSKYFDDKHLQPRQEVLGKRLAQRFDDGWGSELFDVTVGPPLAEAELPKSDVPTLSIVHSAEWSGLAFPTKRPRGIFVGILFAFDVTFAIPEDPKPFKLKIDLKKLAAVSVLKDLGDWPPPRVAAEKVYGAMADDAFEQFGTKLLAHFFKDTATP